jgi:hypothetical protein
VIANKQNYSKNDLVEIQVKSSQFDAVNAFSFALPYDANDFEFVGIEKINTGQLENMTYDRLHTNREKVLYPTFVNIGDKIDLKGSEVLFKIKLKAKRNVKFNLKAIDGILVDKALNSINF